MDILQELLGLMDRGQEDTALARSKWAMAPSPACQPTLLGGRGQGSSQTALSILYRGNGVSVRVNGAGIGVYLKVGMAWWLHQTPMSTCPYLSTS